MVYSCWSTSLLTTQAFIRSTSPMTWATRLRFLILVWWVSKTDRIYNKLMYFWVHWLHLVCELTPCPNETWHDRFKLTKSQPIGAYLMLNAHLFEFDFGLMKFHCGQWSPGATKIVYCDIWQGTNLLCDIRHQLRRFTDPWHKLRRFNAIHNSSPMAWWDSKVSIRCALRNLSRSSGPAWYFSASVFWMWILEILLLSYWVF